VKVWIPIIALFVLVLGLGAGSGCGGGSGGTSTDGGNGTTGGNIARYVVEATKNGVIIDPTNIIQGETVQFLVAGYTATNSRIVQSSSGWSIDPTGESEGTMSASGVFTATASGPQFTVTATAASQQRTGKAQVRPPGQAIVTGRLVNGFSGFVYNAKVDFYDAGNVLVGTSVAQGNGTFRASVPATAVTFEVNKASIPAGYYKEYQYLGNWYLPQGFCRAPLPALTNGATTNLADILIPPTSNNGSSLPPPPPPSPCP
jgi:hypothetical protein